MLRSSLALLVVVGCFNEPGRPSGARDGGGDDGGSDAQPHDAYVGPLKATKLSTAYWDERNSGSGSPGMTGGHWELDLSSAQSGQLLLIIGTVDNGSGNYFDPTTPVNWTKLDEVYTDVPADTQTTIFAWKIAGTNETRIGADYTNTSGSGSAAFVVLAIDGFDPENPIETRDIGQADNHMNTNPVMVTSAGVVVSEPATLLINAMAVDWEDGSNTYSHSVPAGYDELANVSDFGRDQTGYHWSTLVVSEAHHDTGPTGIVTGMMTSGGNVGVGIYGLIAIKPMP
ncbi:hypothetical protein BH11MYX2_BH11MYX2_28950 [soil metagenome]